MRRRRWRLEPLDPLAGHDDRGPQSVGLQVGRRQLPVADDQPVGTAAIQCPGNVPPAPWALRVDDEQFVNGLRENRRDTRQNPREEGIGKVRNQRDHAHGPHLAQVPRCLVDRVTGMLNGREHGLKRGGRDDLGFRERPTHRCGRHACRARDIPDPRCVAIHSGFPDLLSFNHIPGRHRHGQDRQPAGSGPGG